jgi:hypothetical protein
VPRHRHRHGHSGCSVYFLILIAVLLAFFGFHALAPGQGLYSGLSVLPGDADCDGVISVSDVVKLVEHIFESRPIPNRCSDSVVIYADSLLVIKRLVLPVDSTVYAGNYFASTLLQKFLIFKRGVLVDSAAWLYQVLPLSLNRNILPPESLGVSD